MRLTRFCSLAELNKYLSGETLVNNIDHSLRRGSATTAIGFCFTPDSPKKAWRYLKGIVNPEVCIVVDIDKRNPLLHICSGRYIDYSASTCDRFVSNQKREFCLTEYSNKTAKLIKILQPQEYATDEEYYASLLMLKLFH